VVLAWRLDEGMDGLGMKCGCSTRCCLQVPLPEAPELNGTNVRHVRQKLVVRGDQRPPLLRRGGNRVSQWSRRPLRL